ncbi:YihY/virulence factor BrkB family protein [Fulvimarina sp. 2208YS6-2-32]|uniref:YihY/virulence factor BrkB family protein n=1 Tax=Fulvimarina uroteuthidis TaxID=3098149 RepID=A0ABU5I068_9HYPH|nr:YihY/virulence factor BrkB family protein [Fulvimarina sp. 2208YS6-2-32]MDY8108781.1 YihY/virulence factor BrkB family protein [Fulvimarina sp. 2208YS6-2-32]
MNTRTSRGHDAEVPAEIPAGGWKDILWRIYAEIGDDRVMLIAAGVTYYLLLAMVPALSAMVSIYGFIADPATIQDQISALSGIVPAGGMEILNDQLNRLAQQDPTTLGLTFAISLLLALWSANAGMKSLFEAMNVAYDETEDRSFIKLTLVSLAFTLAAIVGAVLFIGVMIVVPVLLDFVGLGQAVEWLVRIGSFVAIALLISLGVAALYRWGPSRANARWTWISPGVALTLVLTLVVSMLFSWYAANFGSYNATYGSLGALIGFMTWIWLSTTVLIIGGELNAEMEHQTARDTTTGRSQPLGTRGAVMADRVAGEPGAGTGRRSGDDKGKSHRDSRRSPHGDGERPRRVSLGTLAFAVPATLILAAMQRRSGTH